VALGVNAVTDVVAPLLQEYVVAPLTVTVADEPLHKVCEGEIAKVGVVFTTTVMIAEPVQVFDEPSTV
jgi:hypothetical protein